MALTDYDWFQFLRARAKNSPEVQEVNFWKPSAQMDFHPIAPLSPFFFKLKRPHYKIAGFGYFIRYSKLPVWLAWDSFMESNGAADMPSLCELIRRYTKDRSIRPDRAIGCTLIAEPIFFEDAAWIPPPADWHANIVQGKTYDLNNDAEGRRIWDECLLRARGMRIGAENAEGRARYGEIAHFRPRLGQGLFRIMVTESYQRACAVTTEHSLPVLEAAHIRPYSEDGEHDVTNGILLRSDIHKLFDRGYVTVTPDYRFEVGHRLKDDFDNGKTYYHLHGQSIHLPMPNDERPAPKLLEWHNEHIFLG